MDATLASLESKANERQAVSREEQLAILQGNAVRLFGFDLDKLAQTPGAQQPLGETDT